MSLGMIICPGCNWAHRSILDAAECRERYELEATENMERYGNRSRTDTLRYRDRQHLTR